MSRPSISTGDILFKSKAQAPQKESPANDQPMHIALIGDFSGRGSRGNVDLEGLASRRAIEIDRDNFDEVFERLKVSLQLPFDDEPISFSEIDELHPDVLLEQASLFSEFRKLLRQLKHPKLFEEAAAQIRAWSEEEAQEQESETESSREADAAIPMPDNLFDSVLSESRDTSQDGQTPIGNIGNMIQSIVAPYVEAKEDPDVSKYTAAVQAAMEQALRKLMHAGKFQNLDANWRSLFLLVRQLETDSSLKLFVLDVSREEMLTDVAGAAAVEETALYKRLVNAQQVPGTVPFAILNFDLLLEDSPEDLRLAAAVSAIAEQAQSLAVCSATGHLAGCDQLAAQEDVSDWNYEVDSEASAAWQAIRQASSAHFLIACAPRFLVRLPYGKNTDPIETFGFEELGDDYSHEFYCWAPGAYLLTLMLAEGFSNSGWDSQPGEVKTVDDLPLHIYTDEDGDSCAQACAETYMRDTVAAALAEVGICSLRSVKGEAAVMIPTVRSIHSSGAVASWASS